MNTSSWSVSVSSCSGIVSPGGSSTTFIPNDWRPSERRASAHFGNGRSKSLRCTIVKPGIASSLRSDHSGSGPIPTPSAMRLM